jgi:hypothetical protein
MQFELTHTFETSLEHLERILFSDKLPEILKKRMTTLIDCQVVSAVRTGDALKRKVRYLPQPLIKSIGPKKVEPEWMEWFEESEYDFASHRGRFRNIPARHRIAAVMKNDGTLVLESLGPKRCRQTLRGDLSVNVFVVGKIAERVIQSNAAKILDDEARVVAEIIAKKEIA